MEAAVAAEIMKGGCRRPWTAMDGADGQSCGLRKRLLFLRFVTSGRYIEITKRPQITLDPVFNVDSHGGLRFEPFPHLNPDFGMS